MPQYLASQLTANMSGKKQDKWRNTLDQRPWQSVQLHPPWLWLTPRPAQKSHIVFLGAGQQPKFSDTEPIPSRPTNRQESFNWDFSQADERRWKDFYIYICKISRKLLLAPSPKTHTLTILTHFCSGWEAKQNHLCMFLTMRISTWHTYKQLFLQEKRNLISFVTLLQPHCVWIFFETSNESSIFKGRRFVLDFSWNKGVIENI